VRARFVGVSGGVQSIDSCRGDGGGRTIHDGFESASVELDIDILRDSYLYDVNPDTNYGASFAFQVQVYLWAQRAQAIMHVDLSVIPAGKTILSAVLWMRTEGPGAKHLECHRLLVDYVEMEVTYNDRKAATPWSAPGAVKGVDYVEAEGGEFWPGNNDYGSGDITTLVQEWYRDGEPNYGMLVRLTVACSAYAFNSSDSPEVDRHPFVRITYS